MNKSYLGIDIGGTAAKIGIVDETGKILAADTFSVCYDHYQTPIIRTVIQNTDAFFEKNNFRPSDLTGIGVSATGQIDSRTGVVSGSAGHIANWLGTPLNDMLGEHYHLPVTSANDANCALLGECWIGAARGFSDVLMITIGTGVGGGILTGGRLLDGARGIAGELGHFPICKDGIRCSCGLTGCYEQYASTTALVKSVSSHPSFSQIPDIDGRYIFQKAKEKDPDILPILDAWIDDIASGLAGLIHILNPELVLIGGGVSSQTELFINPLTESVMKKIMPGFREGLSIRAAALGNGAGLLGAVYYFSEHYNKEDL